MSNSTLRVKTIADEQGLREAVERAPADTPLIVDFDHTLLLSNSTEEYLHSIRPRWLAGLVLTLLGFLKPWRILSSKNGDFLYRDHFRVLILTFLFPWVVLTWKRRAASIGAEFKNETLINILPANENQTMVLASNGYAFIIKPMLETIPIKFSHVLGAKFLTGYRVRKEGKLSLIQNEVGAETLKESIFITDSRDDAPVLNEVRYPVLFEWPGDKRFTALGDVYCPFVYTEKAKWPGRRPVLKNFFLDDVPALLLSITFVTGFSFWSIAATLMFFTAFIAVYELGYRENDFKAAQNEQNPNLSENLEEHQNYPMGVQAWVWSICLSLSGLIFLNIARLQPQEAIFTASALSLNTETLVTWMSFLVLVRTVFWAHNSVPVHWRIYTHGPLQFLRLFGYVLVMPTNMIGAGFLGAIAMSRWMIYSLYRYQGDKKNFPDKVIRLMIFLFFIVAVMLTEKDSTVLSSLQVWLVVLWCLVRGGHQISWPLRNL
jgi:hypothetical protein